VKLFGREVILRSPRHPGTDLVMRGLNEESLARAVAEQRQERNNALGWLARIGAWYVEMEQMNPHTKAQCAEMLKALKHGRWSVRFGRPDWRTELTQIRVGHESNALDLQRETASGLKRKVSAQKSRPASSKNFADRAQLQQAAVNRLSTSQRLEKPGGGWLLVSGRLEHREVRLLIQKLAATECHVSPRTIRKNTVIPNIPHKLES
jgi:hypothetical protein